MLSYPIYNPCMVGGWVVVVYLQLQSLLRSRPPESEIEIELERTWRHPELTWRWSGPEFDNTVTSVNEIPSLQKFAVCEIVYSSNT